MNNIFFSIVEVESMNVDCPVVNAVTETFYPKENYPARVILERSSYRNGLKVWIRFIADKKRPKVIFTPAGLIPTGTFSQGMLVDKRVYCAGVRPLDSETNKICS